ncbi:MAG: hypothetical protein AB3N28_03155 [Kordiimonas sp.]
MKKAYNAGALHPTSKVYTPDTATTLIGFGASAISAYNEGYTQNSPDTGSYYAAINEGRLPTIKGLKLSEEDQLRRGIIEHIMCYKSLDLSSLNADQFEAELTKLKTLEEDGLISIRDQKMGIESNAVQATRLAAAAFDAYLAPSQQKHAQVA